ncbi:MAG TPA: hypothetical protein VD902_00835 [Symbiobacteriaceae bacterium]|nr:hypothetical protein [Symbiobacteriaceae bacterium]
MKRLLLALMVAALLVIFTIPAIASQGKPSDPTDKVESQMRSRF